MSAYKWQFSARFRRHAFGWRSKIPLQRIKEAISEIRKISDKEPLLAAEGAVLFLEKISPALEHVDSSSGAIGNAVNHAIEILVPIISRCVVPDKKRQQWLERLWEAIQNDHMPYIEYLSDFWGELCVTPELSSFWADKFIDVVKCVWQPRTEKTGMSFYQGTPACLSALFAAKRYEELLDLLENAPLKFWHDQRWGAKTLVAMGRSADALNYIEASKGINVPIKEMSLVCEEILISMGLPDEAYHRYALVANQSTTNLATFRALAKKYPNKPHAEILNDLIASQPGSEGKWFAAAKAAGFFDLAVKLVSHSPTDPRTLTRAAKEFEITRPEFSLACGMASLRWIVLGYGYEITNADVLTTYSAVINAGKTLGKNESQVNEKILELLSEQPHNPFVSTILMPYLRLQNLSRHNGGSSS